MASPLSAHLIFSYQDEALLSFLSVSLLYLLLFPPLSFSLPRLCFLLSLLLLRLWLLPCFRSQQPPPSLSFRPVEPFSLPFSRHQQPSSRLSHMPWQKPLQHTSPPFPMESLHTVSLRQPDHFHRRSCFPLQG